MPLELGMFLGARRFGDQKQKQKSRVVLDTEPYRYQQYISDIAGQDIKAHGGDLQRAINSVRDWLASRRGFSAPPGHIAVFKRFNRFEEDLAAQCVETDREQNNLTFVEFADLASTWLKKDLARRAVP
jgi:hypothetical protein